MKHAFHAPLPKRQRPQRGALAEDQLGSPSSANSPPPKEHHPSHLSEDETDTDSASIVSLDQDTTATTKCKLANAISKNKNETPWRC